MQFWRWTDLFALFLFAKDFWLWDKKETNINIYIYSTEGHQSAVFKANFMQFSKLIWYYLM